MKSIFKQIVGKKVFAKEVSEHEVKKGNLVADYLNVFQSIINQLTTMKIALDIKMQAFLLLCSLTWFQLVTVPIRSSELDRIMVEPESDRLN